MSINPKHCSRFQLDSSTTQCRMGWPPCRVKILRRKVWLTPTARVPYSNAANIGERKTGMQSEFCTWQMHRCTSPGDGQTSCKVWLTSVEWRMCSNKAKTWNPLKFAGVPQTPETISAVSGPTFTILWGHVEVILLLTIFFWLLIWRRC